MQRPNLQFSCHIYFPDDKKGMLFCFITIWRMRWSYKHRIYSKLSDRQAWAISVDLDQTPQNAAPDQGLRCLPLTKQH